MIPFMCGQLEEAIQVQPKAMCRAAEFVDKWDGCVCTIVLPGNVNPSPDVNFNPFPAGIVETDPMPPTFPPMPMLPPPSAPNRPYVPPQMEPNCPFYRNCTAEAEKNTGLHVVYGECVGFESWGFHEIHKADYAPASGYLNSISCSYVMHANGNFTVPEVVGQLASTRLHRDEAISRYNETISLVCRDTPTAGSWGDLCKSVLGGPLGPRECQTRWISYWADRCEVAPPPEGVPQERTFGEICPKECEALPMISREPPFPR
jgi:hypothetical protein